MPTKTDRILSYLPQTFKTSPRPEVLYPVADAFGNELLLGENSLAAIMLAHWVDFADKNELRINDLEKMAALYGLAPWRDESGATLESVEEFREHLKRYVRTFLEGTVTVQGILRVTAEALGLRIADQPDQLDRWWAREQDMVVTTEALGNDAAAQLNFDHSSSSGGPALPAQVAGNVDLSEGIDLQGANILRLRVDGSLEEIDLTEGKTTPFNLKQIVEVINRAPRPRIASEHGHYLTLASPSRGSASKLEVVNGANDATPLILGLAPKRYQGVAATAAQFKGKPDLSSHIDLSSERYLRIEIDGKHQQEIDCAGDDAAQTTLNDIRDAINNAFPGLNVADSDGKHLVLTSPTKGIGSSISVQPPAAQNATKEILGVPSFVVAGLDAQPARANSTRDLRGTVDLSERANIRLGIDGAEPVLINCAGVVPNKTERVEIVAAINKALDAVVGIITERGISVVSPSGGPASEIIFEEPDAGDATFDIFGIGPLSFQGSDPTVARLTGTPLLTAHGLDVRANNFLLLAVDGGAPVEIDLSQAGNNQELISLPLNKLAAHINASFGGAAIASTDGKKLFLTSTRTGGVSKLAVLPRETVRKRRFVTRAIVTDEAARDVFGFFARESQGTSAVRARLIGGPDLSQSADLKAARFLRLRVDGSAAIEIDCAGKRPRATTLKEVVDNINSAFPTTGPAKLATDDGKHLVLISPSVGENSNLSIEAPHVALKNLLGLEPETFRGADATGVKFTATVDLTAGIDLPPDAKIKLGIDDASHEIVLNGAAPAHRSPFEIANEINTAFKATLAKTDGRRITLSSAKTGVDSRIMFQEPVSPDVTSKIFGISAPREYHGAAAAPAQVVGLPDLSKPTDLSVFRFLSIAIDGQSDTFDCAAQAVKPETASLEEIVKSIGPIASASLDGKNLILTSPTTGATAQLALQTFNEGDASKPLFGNNPLASAGKAASPAVIARDKNLSLPVDLSRRNLLRIAVDGGRAVDIDVAGLVPAQTAADEIVAQINRAFPNLAALNDDDQLQLTSPTAGPASKLSLQPLRYLEVVEYPLQAASSPVVNVKHNGVREIVNDGVADSHVEIRITAPQGTVGPGVVNSGLGWSVRLFAVIERGEMVRLFRHPRLGLQAEVIAPDGQTHSVSGCQILVGPLGAQARVPFENTWSLSDARSLQLNNPRASSIVLLKGLKPGNDVNVGVLESDISALLKPVIEEDGKAARLVGRVKSDQDGFSLVAADETPIAELLPGADVDLGAYLEKVVKVEGPLHDSVPPLMLVERIAALFDVVFYGVSDNEPEPYLGVSIGDGETDDDSLVAQINGTSAKTRASELVRGEELDKAVVLNIPPGKSNFRYVDCLGSRFDDAYFDEAHFAGGCFNSHHHQHLPVPCCSERGIFDVSRFSNVPPEKLGAVFASDTPFPEPPVQIDFRWEKFSAGSFVVNLPVDLPARFGARFDDARFGQDQESPELYAGAVAEPVSDDNFLEKLIMYPIPPRQPSDFVTAKHVGIIELGWTAARMPFRKPQFLTLGGPGRPARLYLSEEGLDGFIRLEAKEDGAWANEISVSARQAGPAIYDVSIFYRGGRFEQARSIVLGAARETIQEFLRPGPTGVLQAKAAGVRADVTRERADSDQITTTP